MGDVNRKWNAEGITARCKFCGSEGVPLPALNMRMKSVEGQKEYLYAVGCPRCKIHTLHAKTPEEGVGNWNRQIYSDATLMLMNEPVELNEEGAVRLMAGILKDIGEEYIKAKVMSILGESHGGTIRRCQRELAHACELADIDYTAAIRALDKRSKEAEKKCRKAWTQALRAYFRQDSGEKPSRYKGRED